EFHFTRQPKNATVLEDSRYALHCMARGEGACRRKVNVKVKWFKDGVRIPKKGPNYRTIRTSGTLRFNNIKITDRGEYYCKAVCKRHRLTSNEATIQVEAKAKFTEMHPHDRNIVTGSPIQLKCIVAGIPTPQIEWHQENFTLSEGEVPGVKIQTNNDSSHIVRSILYIPRVDHNVTFTCLASNTPLGKKEVIERRAKVVVLPKRDPEAAEPGPSDSDTIQYSCESDDILCLMAYHLSSREF
ncbi:hypothetical protein FSP39_018959, partial [Pinctada imbricata]